MPSAATSVSKSNGAVEPPGSAGVSAAAAAGASGTRSAADSSSWWASSKVNPFEGPDSAPDLPRQLLDDLLELGIVPGQRQRALEVLERRRGVAFAVEDLRQAAHRGQVLGRLTGDELEFGPGLAELPEVEQRPARASPAPTGSRGGA